MKINSPSSTSSTPAPRERASGSTNATTAQQTQTVSKGWTASGASAKPRPSAPAPAPASASATAAPASGYSSVSFNAGLDALTKSRAVSGNKVQMLFDGVQSFAERKKMIEGAKETINFQTFIFNSDETGWELAKSLAAKAKEGVQVRVIYDAVGSGRADPKMFQMMKDAGVEVKDYGAKWKVWDLNDRWHEKHLVVDGKQSIEGGMNVANEYAFGGSGKQVFSRGGQGADAWRDADLKLEGPAVADAQKAFLRNWEELGGALNPVDQKKMFPKLEPLAGGPTVRVVQANPEVKGLNGTTNRMYMSAIQNAKKSIAIENAYFLPPPEIRAALVDAAKRGVDVRVITNSKASNDMGFVSDAGRYFYDDLLKAGVKVFEKQGGTLHSKTATFDGEYSIVGSVNLNGRSKNTDAEVALGVEDKATAKQLSERFNSGLKETKPVTQKELQAEGFLTNLKQWAYSTLAWTF